MRDPLKRERTSLRTFMRVKGFYGVRGARQRNVRDQLIRYVADGRDTFTTKVLMEDAGLDYRYKTDRDAVSKTLVYYRTALQSFFQYAFEAPTYSAWVHDGLTEDQLWDKLAEAAANLGLPAFVYDRYIEAFRPMGRGGWARLQGVKARSVRTYLTGMIESWAAMLEMFPELKSLNERPALPTEGHVLVLPSPATLRHLCRHCETRWTTWAELHEHEIRCHPEKQAQ